jgi:hypothetical protein
VAHERQRRAGGKASHANFIGIERCVADSEAFISLSQLATKLYVDLRRQYNGRNNGDISIADSVLKPYHWSHSSVHKGLTELIEHGLILRTRKGGVTSQEKGTPSLYAFTDLPVMANPDKGIRGSAPSLAYLDFKPAPKVPRKKKSRVHAVNGSVHGVDETEASVSI